MDRNLSVDCIDLHLYCRFEPRHSLAICNLTYYDGMNFTSVVCISDA